MIYTNVKRAVTLKNEWNLKSYKSRNSFKKGNMKKQLTTLAFLLLITPLFAQYQMNTTDKMIQGLLGGLFLGIIGLVIWGISKLINKGKNKN